MWRTLLCHFTCRPTRPAAALANPVMGVTMPDEFSDQFPYKGKAIKVTGSGDSATIMVDDLKFGAQRLGNGMWSSPGVFNHYASPSDLARHIVDYLHQFTPSG